MHFSEGHATLAAYLIGFVAIVLAAIGISLMADTSAKDHRSKTSVKADIRRDQEKLRVVESRFNHYQRRAGAIPSGSPVSASHIADLQERAIDLAERLEGLRETKVSLEREMETATGRLADHTRRYRLQVRAAAVGERIAELTLPSGKVLEDASIRGFDQAGINIHHSHGTARVRYEELPDAWKERLHWDPEEKLALARAETASAVPTVVKAVEKPALPPASTAAPAGRTRVEPIVDSPAVEEARTRYLLSQSRAQQAANDALSAAYKASGPHKSVPGSLETWADRAERLSRSARSAQLEFQRAEAALRALSPHDPILFSQ